MSLRLAHPPVAPQTAQSVTADKIKRCAVGVDSVIVFFVDGREATLPADPSVDALLEHARLDERARLRGCVVHVGPNGASLVDENGKHVLDLPVAGVAAPPAPEGTDEQ